MYVVFPKYLKNIFSFITISLILIFYNPISQTMMFFYVNDFIDVHYDSIMVLRVKVKASLIQPLIQLIESDIPSTEE